MNNYRGTNNKRRNTNRTSNKITNSIRIPGLPKSMQPKGWGGILVLVLVVAVYAWISYNGSKPDEQTGNTQQINNTQQTTVTTQSSNELTEAVVRRVIDGDTVVLTDGERVRFIGIDAPEIGEPGADEATDFVREMIDGKTIWLEADGNDRDRHDRLRRYIWVEMPTDTSDENEIRSKQLNAMLLERGLAAALIVGTPRNAALFRQLEKEAME